MTTENWKIVSELPRRKSISIAFSPKGTYFMTWEPFTVGKSNVHGSPNLFIYNTNTWQEVKSFIHKSQLMWEPQWTSDELICSRLINNDVVFYENANFDTVVHKINFAKIGAYSISPGAAPYHVLCYTPEIKGQPSLGRLFRYPKFDGTSFLANKSFFQVTSNNFK